MYTRLRKPHTEFTHFSNIRILKLNFSLSCCANFVLRNRSMKTWKQDITISFLYLLITNSHFTCKIKIKCFTLLPNAISLLYDAIRQIKLHAIVLFWVERLMSKYSIWHLGHNYIICVIFFVIHAFSYQT